MSKRDFFCSEVFICLSVIVLASLLFFVPAAEVTASPKDKAIKTRFVFFDLTALDSKTGYMWTRDANIAKDNMNWGDVVRFVKKLNEQEYAGYSDWRLPSMVELLTLVNFAKEQGHGKYLYKYLNEIGFENVQSNFYWSSTAYATIATDPWIVSMVNGNMSYGYEADNYYVWPVRSGQ